MSNPFVIPLAGLSIGIVCGRYFPGPNLVLIVIGILLVLLHFAMKTRMCRECSLHIRRAPVLLIFFCLGFSLCQTRLTLHDTYDIGIQDEQRTWKIDGIVSSVALIDEGILTISLDTVTLSGHDITVNTTGKLLVSLYEQNTELAEEFFGRLGKGTRLIFLGKLQSVPLIRQSSLMPMAVTLKIKGVHARSSINGTRKATIADGPPSSAIERFFDRSRAKAEQVLLDWRHTHGDQPEFLEVTSFLTAILLGDRRELSDETQTMFRDTGLYHILAISGLHVGIMAIIIYLPLLIAFPEAIRLRMISVLIILFWYIMMTDWHPSILRAALMIGLYLLGSIFFREANILNTLALSACILLVYEPLYLFQVGFQLTYLAVFSIYFLFDEVRYSLLPWLSRTIPGALMAVSIAVQIGMTPALAYYFGVVPLLSFLAFLILFPVLVLTLLGGFIMILMSQFLPSWGLLVMHVLHPLTGVLMDTVAELHRFPLNTVVTGRWSAASMIVYYAIVIVIIVRPLPHNVFRVSRYALAGLLLMTFLVPAIDKIYKPELAISMLDVGAGDALHVSLPDGRNLLIDGGGSEEDRFDTAAAIIHPWLYRNGIDRLDVVTVSHDHADHLMGVSHLLGRLPIGELWVPDRHQSSTRYRQYLQKARDLLIPIRTIAGITPRPSLKINTNNTSSILKITYGDFSILLPGDAEHEAEHSLLSYGDNLKSTVLKVAHHGSKTSSSEAFLEMVDPDLAFISVRRGGVHEHPSMEVLTRFSRCLPTCPLFMTDFRGTVTVSSDGTDYHIMTDR